VRNGLDQRFHDSGRRSKNFVIPKPQDAISSCGKPGRSFFVLIQIERVLTAIQFDDESMFGAIEVYDVWPDRMLASELQPVQLPGSQDRPETPFCISLIHSQDTCGEHMPLTLTLSPPGRG
jgi:hypothetical protein